MVYSTEAIAANVIVALDQARRPMTPSEVAGAVNASLAQVSPVLSLLREHGHVVRRHEAIENKPSGAPGIKKVVYRVAWHLRGKGDRVVDFIAQTAPA